MKRSHKLAGFIFMATLSSQLPAEISQFERYEVDQQTEETLIASLAQKFLLLQENSRHEGRKVRGTHAKGTCVDGRFVVHGNLDNQLRQGLFAQPGDYPARVRFANGASTVQADRVPDARAVSVAVDLGGNRRQDFSMNNGPIFPIGSIADFNFLLEVGFVKARAYREALTNGMSKEQAAAAAETASNRHLAQNPTRVPGLIRMGQLGAALQNQTVRSYRDLKYWSGSAFKYGENQVAKFALFARTEKITEEPDRTNDNFLQDDLMNAVNSDDTPIEFDFMVQLLDAQRMRQRGFFSDTRLPAWQWVEDVTLDWDAAGAQFHRVGRLTLTPYSVHTARACDDPANAIDVMRNSLPSHQGLGRINRARARAENASRGNR